MTSVLGISAYYHDSAAALVVDGIPVAAAQEERFVRQKHYAGFPRNAVNYVMMSQSLRPVDIDAVVFYEKPFQKLARIATTHLAYAPRGSNAFHQAFSLWLGGKLLQKQKLQRELEDLGFKQRQDVLFSTHHLSHAASAFFPSPFERAAVVTMDGVGEWTTTAIGMGQDDHIEFIKEISFPHSLGLLYSAFTDYLGFKVNSAEYKIMGLAPYGKPSYQKHIFDELIDLKDDGSFRLNMRYFDYCIKPRMTSEQFHRLFGSEPRDPESELTQRDMDLAASVQAVADEVVLRVAKEAFRITQCDCLCMAGGVALNCVANGKLLRANIFRQLWIQPAAGDAGGALGAALYTYNDIEKNPRNNLALKKQHDSMSGSYLGPSFTSNEVKNQLDSAGAKYTISTGDTILEVATEALASGKVVGWFQGRMEFGPRALGNRSILADPRKHNMQRILNLKIKFRESFRPFAPSVLATEARNWFQLEGSSPYMLLVAEIATGQRREIPVCEDELFGIDKLNVTRSTIPSVTHVDYSARIHTVTKENNPTFHRLLSSFFLKTGCPILVNTSFNVRGEPIVCTPTDAYQCFMGTEIDLLIIENYVLYKESQIQSSFTPDYNKKFEKD